MVGGVVADDVDDRDLALTRVVQVREAVPQSRTEVKQRRARRAGHACEAVGRPGRHALE